MPLQIAQATSSANGSGAPLLARPLAARTVNRAIKLPSVGFGASMPSGGTLWQPTCDAIVRRGDMEFRFGTSAQGGESAQVRAQMIQAAFEFAKAGDVITIEPGIYDFGRGGPYLLPPCLVRGSGSGVTIFQSEKLIDGEAATPTSAAIGVGPSFALQNGTVLVDVSLQTTPWHIYEDGGCVGFLPTTTSARAIVQRCEIQANDWAVYNWSPGNALLLTDSTITSGRVCIAAENSGDGQNFTIERCTLIGDASLSSSIGATSNRVNGGVFGVVARGGNVRIIDCEMSLKGETPTWPSFTPRVCGVTDLGGGNDDSATIDAIQITNLRCSIDPNGSDPTRCFDLDLHYSTTQTQFRATPGRGSAIDGTLSRSWKSPSSSPWVSTSPALDALQPISLVATR